MRFSRGLTVSQILNARSVAGVATLGAAAVIGLAIWAQPLIELCTDAARALMIP